jgi:RNA polymerase sigma-70 factor (ECF subfamily)
MLTLIVIIDTDDRVMIERYYKELKTEMRYVAFCVLKDSSEADAAVQEAFTRIMYQIDSFKAMPDKQKAGYCFAAVRNISLNMNRKAKNMRIVLVPIDSDVADDNEALETTLIRQDELALLKDKVEELDAEYRIPLILRFADNLRYKEIAALLDISDATARKRVERAIDRITAAFRKEGLLDV